MPVVHVEDRHAKIEGKTGQVGFVEVSSAREDGSSVSVDKTCFVLSVFEVGGGVDQNADLAVGNDRRTCLTFRIKSTKKHIYKKAKSESIGTWPPSPSSTGTVSSSWLQPSTAST